MLHSSASHLFKVLFTDLHIAVNSVSHLTSIKGCIVRIHASSQQSSKVSFKPRHLQTCWWTWCRCKQQRQKSPHSFLKSLFPVRVLLWKLSHLCSPQKRNPNSCIRTLCWLCNHPPCSCLMLSPSCFWFCVSCFPPSNMQPVKWINEHRVNFSSSFSFVFPCQQNNKLVAGKALFVSSA